MSSERYARAKEVFHHARHLAPGSRDEYLAQTCGDDTELRRSVEGLLAHHDDRTVLATPPPPAEGEGGAAGGPGDAWSGPDALRRGSTSAAATGTVGSWMRTLSANKGRIALGVALLALLGALGLWTRGRVRASVDELLEGQLQTILDADVMALRQWLGALETETELWAQKSKVRDDVRALVELAADTPPAGLDATLRAAPEGRHLRELLTEVFASGHGEEHESDDEHERHLLSHRRFDGFGIVSLDGLLLTGGNAAAMSETGYGKPLNEQGRYVLDECVRRGTAVVVPPFERGSLVEGLMVTSPMPVMMVATVVYDEQQEEPVGLLCLLVEPSEEFAAILTVARMGETGETYAFDGDGRMLSESHFLDHLHQARLIPTDAHTSVLNLRLADPGGDLTQGFAPPSAPEAWDLTRAVGSALAGEEGVDTSGYRDYRGVEVAGAWTWLDDYGFGVVSEIDLAEGQATMRELQASIRILMWLALGLGLGATAVAWRSLRLKDRLDRAMRYGQYEVVRPLGEGGMGTVYLARHAMLSRPTAVKVLKAKVLDPATLERFKREVQVTARLTHPNTVEIFDFGTTSNHGFYYAMEYLPGLGLRDLVKRFGPQPQGRVLSILDQICGSLEEAHERGLIHRDIKPQNVILCERGGRADVVKVLDFGLVKSVSEAEDVAITQAGQTTGTPLYMAPERFEGSDHVDGRADLWAVGCVAYYLLTGRDAFAGKTVVEVWNKVVHDDPTPLTEACGQPLHPDFAAMIHRCLSKDPRERPPTAGALRDALAALDVPRWTRHDARRWWEERGDALPLPDDGWPDEHDTGGSFHAPG